MGKANRIEKLDELQQIKVTLQEELDKRRADNHLCHKEILETARKSQEFHNGMLGKISEVEGLKAKADEIHASYVETRQRMNQMQAEIKETLKQIKRLRDEVQKEEVEKLRKKEEALRKKIQNKAQKKLDNGEKLTWEEFQILSENRETTQD